MSFPSKRVRISSLVRSLSWLRVHTAATRLGALARSACRVDGDGSEQGPPRGAAGVDNECPPWPAPWRRWGCRAAPRDSSKGQGSGSGGALDVDTLEDLAQCRLELVGRLVEVRHVRNLALVRALGTPLHHQHRHAGRGGEGPGVLESKRVSLLQSTSVALNPGAYEFRDAWPPSKSGCWH